MDPSDSGQRRPSSDVAGFWPRVGASTTDSVVLWPVTIPTSFIIGYGPASWAIAWIILASPLPWLYTSYCHGRWGKTLGKHAARIRVVRNEDEGPVGYRRAFLRDSGTIVFSLAAAAMMIHLVVAGNTQVFRIDVEQYEYRIVESEEPPGFFEIMSDAYSEAFSGYSPWMVVLLFTQSGWFLAEIVTMLTNARRRALHDYIGRTVVVAVPFAYMSLPAHAVPPAPIAERTPRPPSRGW
jgi:uncharacterized RDD family membrane protein YckC